MGRYPASLKNTLKNGRMAYGAISQRASRGGSLLKLGFATLATCLLAFVGYRFFRPPARLSYGLMIDAGSTGSRMHTFAFRKNGVGDLKLLSEDFYPVKPGLSAFKNDPSAAALSIEPLLVRARARVPAEKHEETPVFLRATAGLRLTGEAQAEAILKAVRLHLKKSGFRFDADSWASILGGNDEGIYSWITVNYLLGRKSAAETLGTLEMGGGSAQVAFVPPATEPGKCATGRVAQRYRGHTVGLFTKSDLGHGLQKARARVLAHFEYKGTLLSNPCINRGGNIRVPVPFDPAKRTVIMAGEGNFEHCLHQIAGALVKPSSDCKCNVCGYDGSSRPRPIKEYVAFAYYLERTVALGMKTPMTVLQIREKGDEICKSTLEEVRQKYKIVPNGVAEDLCFDLAYIVTHLEYAHGISASSDVHLHVKDKIEEIELGWALGAMFDEMSKLKAS